PPISPNPARRRFLYPRKTARRTLRTPNEPPKNSHWFPHRPLKGPESASRFPQKGAHPQLQPLKPAPVSRKQLPPAGGIPRFGASPPAKSKSPGFLPGFPPIP